MLSNFHVVCQKSHNKVTMTIYVLFRFLVHQTLDFQLDFNQMTGPQLNHLIFLSFETFVACQPGYALSVMDFEL